MNQRNTGCRNFVIHILYYLYILPSILTKTGSRPQTCLKMVLQATKLHWTSSQLYWRRPSIFYDMKLIAVLLLFSLCVCSEQVCFPGQDISECLGRKNKTSRTESSSLVSRNEDEERIEISERSSVISGRYCFSTRGYSGHCEYSSRCPRSYSYSRTCGWNHVCCKEGSKKEYFVGP